MSLETFGQACAVAIDEQLREVEDGGRHGGEIGVSADTMPELFLPEDVDWRWISPGIANDILGMRVRVVSSRHAIAKEYQPIAAGYSYTMSAELRKQARILGAHAWNLAQRLRREVGLPVAEVHGEEWDFTQVFDHAKAPVSFQTIDK
ncbi:hypothetical protein [Cupriavidus pauculus]|uniref:hypothetical protein n=1 Tax=Cupriavidus pauculus TaxID=82633 RepID=UPI001EE2DE4B|nr:hypothetical protein [Cupriavidus pauculus]GJG96841.1 hypothetical protein CBA19C6_20150 [Cupriavidus pauculus]